MNERSFPIVQTLLKYYKKFLKNLKIRSLTNNLKINIIITINRSDDKIMEKVWVPRLEVDTKKIINNIESIKKFVGSNVEVMPIIKDKAYGTGINEQLEVFEKTGTKIVGVAIVDEGIALREAGYNKEIFILNQPFEEEIPAIAKYGLTIGVGSIEFLHKLGEYNYKFNIHIEIGSGMGRTGIRPSRVEEYLEELKKYPNIKIEGIYTHFSCSDCDEKYTKAQISSFNQAVEQVKKQISDLKYIHCCNSAGILNFPEAHFNLVRPGILIYGYLPANGLKNKINLQPSIRLISKISFLKEVGEGTSISYGRRFITKRKTKVATVPLGYADGIRRALSNKGYVVIQGKKVPIIGAVCMDCFMVDVTDIEDVTVGNDVFIWDNEKITVEDIANIYDTISYEVISTISNRVIRKYI